MMKLRASYKVCLWWLFSYSALSVEHPHYATNKQIKEILQNKHDHNARTQASVLPRYWLIPTYNVSPETAVQCALTFQEAAWAAGF